MTTEDIVRQDEREWIDKGRREVEKLNNKLSELKIELVAIDSIYPNPYNPNRQNEREFELLMQSIKEDGFTQPVIVHQQTRMIVDGEHRWRALNHLGQKEIAVVFTDMTDAQMRISTLRHNRARGSEDIELTIGILNDLRELGALDRVTESLKIDDLELQALLDDVSAPDALADDDYAEAWIPTKAADVDRPEAIGNDGRRISTSDSALVELERLNEKYDEVDSHLDAREISTEAHLAVSQVSATFQNEDAKLVRAALGKKPAQALIQLCVMHVLANKQDYSQWLYEVCLAVKGRWK